MKLSVKSDCIKAALSLGSFTCWFFSINRLTELNLHNNFAESNFAGLRIGFHCGEFAVLAAIFVLLTIFDIEKFINKSYIKPIPGALLFAVTAAFMFISEYSVWMSVIAGVASAFGIVAVLTSFLKVRTRHRMYVIGSGIGTGALLSVLICEVLPIISDSRALYLVSVGLLAVLALLTIHFEEFSVYSSGSQKRFEKQTARYIFSKIPFEYLLFIPVCAVYLLAYHLGDDYVSARCLYNTSFNYKLISALVFAIASVLIGLFVKPHNAPGLFASACALTGAGTFFISASVMTNTELALFSLFGKIGYSCFLSGVFLFITAFSVDRLHPLLFSVTGYTAFALGELISNIAALFTENFEKISIPAAITLLVLTLVSMLIISRGLTKHGYSEYAIERRRRIRRRISALAEEKGLSGKEKAVLELIVAEECSVDELKYRLFVPSSSIRRYLNGIEKRTGKKAAELKAELWDNDDENALNDL